MSDTAFWITDVAQYSDALAANDSNGRILITSFIEVLSPASPIWFSLACRLAIRHS